MVDIAAHYGLVQGKDWSCPDPRVFNVVKGIPVEVLNQLYNAADLVISTTLGEGHGLSLTEAMACKIPVLFPRHSAIEELIGPNEERGTFIKCGGVDHTLSLGRMDPIPVRPVVHVDDMVDKMVNIYRYPSKYKKKADVAYEWAIQNTWASKGIQWRELLAEALKAQEEENARQSESEQGTPDRGEAAAPSS
jgi:glycosyltransferase involved in cell wall biosynthesis